ncbi:hypothetical protein KPATCC21470_3559 [Kitasatospora purpeofusca]
MGGSGPGRGLVGCCGRGGAGRDIAGRGAAVRVRVRVVRVRTGSLLAAVRSGRQRLCAGRPGLRKVHLSG